MAVMDDIDPEMREYARVSMAAAEGLAEGAIAALAEKPDTPREDKFLTLFIAFWESGADREKAVAGMCTLILMLADTRAELAKQ